VFTTASLLVFALVSWMRSRFSTDVDLHALIVPTVIQGAAVACFFIPLVALALSGLPPERIAAATGLNNFLRITAGAFGTSISTTLWENRAALHHARLTERATLYDAPTRQALDSLAASGLGPDQAHAYLNRLIDQQAFTLAALDLFYASAILLVLLIPLVWIARPQKGAAGAAAAGAH
jgi:DHA2 family multidrug resistance protein